MASLDACQVHATAEASHQLTIQKEQNQLTLMWNVVVCVCACVCIPIYSTYVGLYANVSGEFNVLLGKK